MRFFLYLFKIPHLNSFKLLADELLNKMLLNSFFSYTKQRVLFYSFLSPLSFCIMSTILFCYHCNHAFLLLRSELFPPVLSSFFYLCAIWLDCCLPTVLSLSCHLGSLFHHLFPTLYTSTFIFCFPFLKEYSNTLYCCLHL